MAEAKKCANPACTCIPPNNEKFCSPHCESLDDSLEIVCQCGHPHCGVSSTTEVVSTEVVPAEVVTTDVVTGDVISRDVV